ncbi:MAG: cob(I)yrinic acid a,c-diamide adenosyltransferase [Clostridia bacterium]|nr:cob(I)yrinic acid a,c-diamide adenosyltransferase [Clostridia bacterium]
MAVHIYFGDGKGKSTCAAGLAARFSGHGGKVFCYRFLKCDKSGEDLTLCGKITVRCTEENFGFVFQMSDEEKQRFENKTRKLWEEAKNCDTDLLILDEILGAVEVGFISEDEVLSFIEKADCEVVLTGRMASERLIGKADYVTEMRKIKHIYDSGISARKGIEF